jgi:hypothetical protein
LYTEQAEIPLHLSTDTLFAADMLFLDKLKTLAVAVITTLGIGTFREVKPPAQDDESDEGIRDESDEALSIYEVVRTGWLTRVRRLEEFGAKMLAQRLEDYIDEEEFAQLVRESASRIQSRQETDSIELVDECVSLLSVLRFD